MIRPLENIDDIAHLADEADAEGYPFVRRFITDWHDGSNLFDKPGECAFIGTVADEVVSVCGLNIDVYAHDPSIGRVRHLYVSARHRRSGLATELVDVIIDEAKRAFRVLRLRTRNPDAAAFYESRGFERVDDDEYCTHLMRFR